MNLIKRFLATTLCAILTIGAYAADDLTPEQLEFRSQVLAYIEHEGMDPYIDNNDNSVTFRHNEVLYWVAVGGESPFYVEFHAGGFKNDDIDINTLLQACNNASRRTRCAKAILKETTVTFVIEEFYHSADEFCNTFSSNLGDLQICRATVASDLGINDGSSSSSSSGAQSAAASDQGLAATLTHYLNSLGGGSGNSSQSSQQPQRPQQQSSTTTTGTLNGHQWVDLGLPSGTKWATTNVGAQTQTDYGNYYSWGETAAKTSYTRNNARREGSEYGDISGDSRYDAARAQWGSSWRLPTSDEQRELLDNCDVKLATIDGVNGLLVVSRVNGQSIFLPAGGFKFDSNPDDFHGQVGHYWSSTPAEDDELRAYRLFYNEDGEAEVSRNDRYDGKLIRPVTR